MCNNVATKKETIQKKRYQEVGRNREIFNQGSGYCRKLYGDQPEALMARGRSGAAKEEPAQRSFRKTEG